MKDGWLSMALIVGRPLCSLNLLPSSTFLPFFLLNIMDRPKEGPKASGENERVEFATLQPNDPEGISEDLEKEGRVEYWSRAEKRRISRKLDVRMYHLSSRFDAGCKHAR